MEQARSQRDGEVQQRRIAVLIRYPVVPKRKPRKIPGIVHDVPREADIHSFDRAHLVQILSPKQLAANVQIYDEQSGSAKRRARPAGKRATGWHRHVNPIMKCAGTHMEAGRYESPTNAGDIYPAISFKQRVPKPAGPAP